MNTTNKLHEDFVLDRKNSAMTKSRTDYDKAKVYCSRSNSANHFFSIRDTTTDKYVLKTDPRAYDMFDENKNDPNHTTNAKDIMSRIIRHVAILND